MTNIGGNINVKAKSDKKKKLELVVEYIYLDQRIKLNKEK